MPARGLGSGRTHGVLQAGGHSELELQAGEERPGRGREAAGPVSQSLVSLWGEMDGHERVLGRTVSDRPLGSDRKGGKAGESLGAG